jgi:L-asparaginase II
MVLTDEATTAGTGAGLLARVALLAETTRGGVLESAHLGALAVSDGSGRVLRSLGDAELLNFPRSSIKPFQLSALVEAGGIERFDFTPVEVAVMAASHSGEAMHVAAVRSILDKIEAGAECLDCGAHEPIDLDAAAALRASGQPPEALHNNCSGKHVAMLALARLLGAPLAGYLDPGHPAQRAIRVAIGEVLELDPATLRHGYDGCSAPAYAVPLRSMALGFARLGDPSAAPPRWRWTLEQIGAAMRAHPQMVGGSTGRIDTDLMRLGTGLTAKGGAEGYFCVAQAGGYGLALKVLDGDAADRGRHVAVTAALRALSWLRPEDFAGPLGVYGPVVPVQNWAGRQAGEVRPSQELLALLPLS